MSSKESAQRASVRGADSSLQAGWVRVSRSSCVGYRLDLASLLFAGCKHCTAGSQGDISRRSNALRIRRRVERIPFTHWVSIRKSSGQQISKITTKIGITC
jgi:hypothetical protein